MTQLFCENVRNNVDQWVVAALREGEQLALADHAELQHRITEYEQQYVFSPRVRAVPVARFDRVLREFAVSQWRMDNAVGDDREPPAAELQEYEQDAGLQQAAQAQVAAEQAAAQQALAELL